MGGWRVDVAIACGREGGRAPDLRQLGHGTKEACESDCRSVPKIRVASPHDGVFASEFCYEIKKSSRTVVARCSAAAGPRGILRSFAA